MDAYTLFKDFAGPVATVIAATTAGGIAFWIGRSQIAAARLQATTANDRLVLDLFERRLEVYTRARAALAKVVTSGQAPSQTAFEFLTAIDGAKFLFGPEVADYFETLYQSMLDVDDANSELKGGGITDQDRARAAQQRRKKMNTISDFYKVAPTLLAPYLSAHYKSSAYLHAPEGG